MNNYENSDHDIHYKVATIKLGITQVLSGTFDSNVIDIDVFKMTEDPNAIAHFNMGDIYKFIVWGPDVTHHYHTNYCEVPQPIPLEVK